LPAESVNALTTGVQRTKSSLSERLNLKSGVNGVKHKYHTRKQRNKNNLTMRLFLLVDE